MLSTRSGALSFFKDLFTLSLPNSSSRKFTLGKTLILCKRCSNFIDETNLPSHGTHIDLEVI